MIPISEEIHETKPKKHSSLWVTAGLLMLSITLVGAVQVLSGKLNFPQQANVAPVSLEPATITIVDGELVCNNGTLVTFSEAGTPDWLVENNGQIEIGPNLPALISVPQNICLADFTAFQKFVSKDNNALALATAICNKTQGGNSNACVSAVEEALKSVTAMQVEPGTGTDGQAYEFQGQAGLLVLPAWNNGQAKNALPASQQGAGYSGSGGSSSNTAESPTPYKPFPRTETPIPPPTSTPVPTLNPVTVPTLIPPADSNPNVLPPMVQVTHSAPIATAIVDVLVSTCLEIQPATPFQDLDTLPIWDKISHLEFKNGMDGYYAQSDLLGGNGPDAHKHKVCVRQVLGPLPNFENIDGHGSSWNPGQARVSPLYGRGNGVFNGYELEYKGLWLYRVDDNGYYNAPTPAPLPTSTPQAWYGNMGDLISYIDSKGWTFIKACNANGTVVDMSPNCFDAIKKVDVAEVSPIIVDLNNFHMAKCGTFWWEEDDGSTTPNAQYKLTGWCFGPVQ